MILIKRSDPGWEKEFQTEEELKTELYNWICKDCKEGCDEEYEGFVHVEPPIGLTSSLAEMLSTSCGCEFCVEEMNEGIKDKSFKSVQEIYAYLGAGGIVKAKNNAIIYYFENDELTREYTKDGRKDTQREKETRSEIMFFNFDIVGSF